MTDKVIDAAIAQLGIQPFKTNEPAVPQGSRQVVPEPTPQPSAPEKKKKVTLSLTTSQETRCIREAAVLNISVKEFLQQMLDDKLGSNIGAPLIAGASFMGKKVTAPTNSYGQDV